MAKSDVPKGGQILIYQTEAGQTKIEVRLEGQTLWLNQAALAKLYQTTIPNINIHIKNIYDEAELSEEATVKDYLIVQTEGARKVSRQFKEELVDQFLPVGQAGHLEGKDLAEANEIRWNRILAKCLAVMEKDSGDIHAAKKSVYWKALIALFMKDNTSVTNVWLTNHLNMGIPQGVSRSTRKLADSKGRKHKKYLEMIRIPA